MVCERLHKEIAENLVPFFFPFASFLQYFFFHVNGCNELHAAGWNYINKWIKDWLLRKDDIQKIYRFFLNFLVSWTQFNCWRVISYMNYECFPTLITKKAIWEIMSNQTRPTEESNSGEKPRGRAETSNTWHRYSVTSLCFLHIIFSFPNNILKTRRKIFVEL